MIIPTKTQVRAIRILGKQTQKEAALLLGVSERFWQYVEEGEKTMSARSWEHYLIKANMLNDFLSRLNDEQKAIYQAIEQKKNDLFSNARYFFKYGESEWEPTEHKTLRNARISAAHQVKIRLGNKVTIGAISEDKEIVPICMKVFDEWIETENYRKMGFHKNKRAYDNV
jgi:hypothetical protein